MRNILSLSFFLLATSFVYAQSDFRIQGGLNIANVSVTNNGRVNSANSLTSFQLGVIGDLHIASVFYIQTGLLYTGKGSQVRSGDESSGTFYKATSNPFYLELPVNALFKIPVSKSAGFFAGAGPYVAMGVGGKNKVEGQVGGSGFSETKDIAFSNDDPTTLNYQEGAGLGILRKFDYGLNGTAGIEGRTFVLGANYGLGLAKLQSTANSSQNDNNKHRVLSVFVGLKF